MRVTRSELAQRILYLGSDRLSLRDYPYLYDMYDGYYTKVLYMTARQVSKSTTFSSFLITDSVCIDGFKSLYVTPSADQTKYFSNNRLGPMIKDSEYVVRNYYNKERTDNVLNKEFTNKSWIHLRYAFLTADRIRGMSVDSIYHDETQDIMTDLLPIIQHCSFRSKYSWLRFSGTPKSFSNTLTKLWEDSNQTKWAIKCTGCSKYDFLDSPKNVGRTGPICKGCGKSLNYMNGEWVTCNKSGKFQGYHISQLMIPIPEHQWEMKILSKLEGASASPKHVFYNEVLGLPYDTADSPVTRAEIEECCDPSSEFCYHFPMQWGGYRLVMGIDWGYGISSYTVAVVGVAMADGRFRILWAKKYQNPIERDFRVQIADLTKWAYIFKVHAIGADWGAGVDRITELRAKIPDKPIFAFQATNSSRKLYYDPRDDIYRHSRTQTLTDRFVEIRNKQVVFPRWQVIEPFAEDILNEFIEYASSGKIKGQMIYDHAVDRPDDFLHAWNYSKMSADVLRVNSSNLIL